MDALSHVLRAIQVRGGLFFRVELTPPFGVWTMPQHELEAAFGNGEDRVLPFHMVTEGSVWLGVEGDEPVLLHAHDIIVLPTGTRHALLDAPDRDPIPVGAVGQHVTGDPPTLRLGRGAPTGKALCGYFRCTARRFNPLLEALPAVMVIRRDPERSPWLCATLRRAFTEDMRDSPGGEALVSGLTELLFVEVVQSWVRTWVQEHGGPGWLAGLTDPLVGRALEALHQEPAHAWTVDALARRVGASRSVLAARFRETVGMPVIRYLTAWRMELAADRLRTTQASVAEIASEVGYASEAALNRAFKRYLGEPPASWRRAVGGSSGISRGG